MARASAPPVTVTREEVLAFRVRRHGLDAEAGGRRPGLGHVGLLDYGIQDSGPDGAAWALAIRGAAVERRDELVLAWTIRGAPHAYRRSHIAAVAVATAPLSEADAGSRIHDASKPFRLEGIPVLDALRTVAAAMRAIVTEPRSKGEVSAALTGELSSPYLRTCRPCDAIHPFEMPFRLAALQAGLELEPGTSPPTIWRPCGSR